MKMELITCTWQRLFPLVGLFLLIGCAAGPKTPSGASIEKDVIGALERGEIRLTCGVRCAFLSGTNKNRIEAQYKAGAWRNIARKISEIGFESDLAYFLLGRSAEELGYQDAAMNYYLLALNSSYKCPSIDSCSGFSFPEDILERRDLLAKAKIDAKPKLSRQKNQRDFQLGSEGKDLKLGNGIKLVNKPLPSMTEKDASSIAVKDARPENVIDVIGIYPGISTRSQVESKKSGSFLLIGGYEILCTSEFMGGKISLLYCETGKDRLSKDTVSGWDRPVTNIEVHNGLLKGFSEKFGPPRLKDEAVQTKLGVGYVSQNAVWEDELGNRLTIISIFNSVDRGLLLLESSKAIAHSKEAEELHDKRRKF